VYAAWCAAIEPLGYSQSPYIVDAADYGMPQHRELMFLALTRSKNPNRLNLPKQAHIAASSSIDFDAGRYRRSRTS
jgi:DNA (cytosine-5)-methyltransferase 1